jgi:hypothetical protein
MVAAEKPPEESQKDHGKPPGRVGMFIIRYPTFLSSVLIGIAGLIATSIWQYRQQQTQKSQAAAAQKVAETQAANSWKIERTDILAKNLETLAQSGSASADQRYGVLLSLTRAEIIDPELAVSYALELGKDSTDYMRSVLANTRNKDYERLLRAYTLSCEERYGTSPAIDACTDKLAARSEALGELIAQETDTALTAGSGTDPGPLALLRDERHVQLDIQPLTGLFEATLLDLYDRRAWEDIDRLQKTSVGAHLVASLGLAAAHTGEFVSDDEEKTLSQFHSAQTKWLTDYLSAKTCDPDCKGRLLEVMVSHYEEAQGDYDAAVKKLLESPRAVSGPAVSRLHSRILWCQVDDSDLTPLRDRALIPAATELLKSRDTTSRDDVISLLALLPDPGDTEKVLGSDEAALKLFHERRAIALRQRATPPATMRKISFCNVKPAATGSAAAGE